MMLSGYILFMSGLFSLVYNRKHFLVILLSMEMVMLGLFFVLYFKVMSFVLNMLMFYFVLVVCEASLGLSILVMCVYYYGVDLMLGKSVLSC